MNPQRVLLEDYLRNKCKVKELKIRNSVRRNLSPREQWNVELHSTILTEKKLVVIASHPERLKEVIFIVQGNPGKIYRYSLGLKQKKNPRKA